MEKFDIVVVGAGVVGLAVAARLSKKFSDVLLIEKNTRFGEETSSRNSEVIHAGIYYPQDSLKAKLCVEGKEQLYQYCQNNHIPYQKVGKLLVAHNDKEEAFLEKTIQLANNNGVNDLIWQSAKQLQRQEPALSASSALLSPSTGIIDVHRYMQSLLADFERSGGVYVANTELLSAKKRDNGFVTHLLSVAEPIQVTCKFLINSGGLHSTKVASLIEGISKQDIPLLHWCRGHYFSYSGKSPFKHLIYPIPQAHGLGIHASLDVGGQLKFGPDTQYVNQLTYGVSGALIDKFYYSIQKYFPAVERNKLHSAYSGIRPKLQGERDSFRDFMIQTEKQHGVEGLINLFGIDSPGLTSSLAIANYVEKVILDV
jgi:L-2-hydroxyglutarate oxidase LhgO